MADLHPVEQLDYDVLVIGSGFGGSVAALRLTEKGYRVGVLEAGRRFAPDTLPSTSWDLRNFLWAPRLGFTGIQRIALIKDVMIVSGAGVGGGSLVYANTLYRPLEPFYDDEQWRDITDWRDELAPHYDQAERMLGVDTVPFETAPDRVMKKVAEEMGVGDTYHPTNVGVYFGTPGQTDPDPYFGGKGPDRTGCIRCGECMTGCRHGAKNMLTTNYLHLAEQAGCEILPEQMATAVRPDGDAWMVETKDPRGRAKTTRQVLRAGQVVMAAGALGTQRLLHEMRDEGVLGGISPTLGTRTRTNSEAILGASAKEVGDVDMSKGIAITSSFHPDEHTHVEPVRYGKGSNFMSLLTTIMVDGGGSIPRQLRFLLQVLLHPITFLRSLSVKRWSERSIILLVMQSLDNSIDVFRKKGPFGTSWLSSRQGHGEPNPTWIPVGNEIARRLADELDPDGPGIPQSSVAEVLMDVPTTAHIIGGCPIGDSVETGVLDAYQRVHGYTGLHVFDGSAISANLGVNPSLTITAQAERAVSLWPNKGEQDPRPRVGEPYRRVDPVKPVATVVPDEAPGALWYGKRTLPVAG